MFLLVGLVALIYLALVFVVGRTTPSHLTVGGVDVSSMPPEEAERSLEREAERLLEQPVTVVAAGEVRTSADSDHTVKIDASGLTPRTWYHYRFAVLSGPATGAVSP